MEDKLLSERNDLISDKKVISNSIQDSEKILEYAMSKLNEGQISRSQHHLQKFEPFFNKNQNAINKSNHKSKNNYQDDTKVILNQKNANPFLRHLNSEPQFKSTSNSNALIKKEE